MTTIRDVAKASGVSVATVSYVLNNGPRPVGAETRERVLETMRRLNYVPSAAARRLAGHQMHTIGVLFGYVETEILTNPYAATVLQGILSAAAEARYNVTLFTAPWENAETSAIAFRDGRTDGILVVAPVTDSDMIPGLAAQEIPVVSVSGPSQTPGVPSVDVDNRKGARLATQYLLSLGHKRIAHLSGHNYHADVIERQSVFEQVMAEAGIKVPPVYLPEGTYHWPSARKIIRELLCLPDRPTAIFAGNDTLALHCIEVARQQNLRVPEDLSIIGFDDVPMAALASPPLTTIRQPIIEIGAYGTRLLTRLIQAREEGHDHFPADPMDDGSVLLEPELVIRDSCGPPP